MHREHNSNVWSDKYFEQGISNAVHATAEVFTSVRGDKNDTTAPLAFLQGIPPARQRGVGIDHSFYAQQSVNARVTCDEDPVAWNVFLP
jgi:hypothetical protein